MRDAFRNDCKSCNLAAKKARYQADPQKYNDGVMRSRRLNPERYAEYDRTRRLRPEVKLQERDAHLRRTFGITVARHDEMLDAQGGGCAICGRALGRTSRCTSTTSTRAAVSGGCSASRATRRSASSATIRPVAMMRPRT